MHPSYIDLHVIYFGPSIFQISWYSVYWSQNGIFYNLTIAIRRMYHNTLKINMSDIILSVR